MRWELVGPDEEAEKRNAGSFCSMAGEAGSDVSSLAGLF